ncbi:hypothetical protein MTO96_045212 [Rhipicephalus appendiculatus]
MAEKLRTLNVRLQEQLLDKLSQAGYLRPVTGGPGSMEPTLLESSGGLDQGTRAEHNSSNGSWRCEIW